jgi:hypothetical protein
VNVTAMDTRVQEILAGATVDGAIVRLASGRLKRAEYIKVDKVLVGLGGKWDRRAGGHRFPFDPSGIIQEVTATGNYVNRAQELQFFETPEPLADRMAVLADVGEGCRVLEPSAGLGALVRPLVRLGAHVTAVEMDHHNAEQLSSLSSDVHEGDFLKWATGASLFDAVVMNPPFARRQDIEHVKDAWRLLRLQIVRLPAPP